MGQGPRGLTGRTGGRAGAVPLVPSTAATEVELVMSCLCSGGSDGQAGLGEAAAYEVAAVLDVPWTASDALDEVFGGGEGDVGEPAAS